MAGNKPFNKPQTETRERDPQLAGLKVPPHSIEAEQSVLGGLMLDNERWDDVAERVVAEDFIPVRTVISLPKWRACRSRAARLT
jgi:replicative DNA helicase